MLYAIKGRLIKKDNLRVIIDVNGIYFDVIVPLSTSEQLPNEGEVELFVELVIGEKSVKLYGFLTEEERLLFNELRKISKIGAQTAISILSNVSVKEFYEAIEKQDNNLLISIPGIGKKTALSIIVEMASKLPKQDQFIPNIVKDTIDTLINLGFAKNKTSEIVTKIYQSNPNISLEELIKESLKKLKNVR